MGSKAAVVAFSLLLPLFGAVGCGGVHYAVTVTGAAGRLAEARETGAEHLAPYEYHYAKAHLEQAKVEASEASYSDAAKYAAIADEYALKAVEASRAKRRAEAAE